MLNRPSTSSALRRSSCRLVCRTTSLASTSPTPRPGKEADSSTKSGVVAGTYQRFQKEQAGEVYRRVEIQVQPAMQKRGWGRKRNHTQQRRKKRPAVPSPCRLRVGGAVASLPPPRWSAATRRPRKRRNAPGEYRPRQRNHRTTNDKHIVRHTVRCVLHPEI